ncbi:NTP transferase domain-containing protein [Candidatus Bathyarchaeota archaeon]|nr:NTP transferase domain-containing protein [Candidatus Bathyarchaeota archaeon]
MKAVILAAGEGQRLRPLTLTRPKHMIQVAGKPLLEHLLEVLKKAGFTDILMIVNYKAERITEYFGDGEKLGLKIKYVFQKEIRGTANAFGTAENKVEGDFLAVYGDLLISPDVIKAALKLHCNENPAVTMTVLHVERPEQYGVLETRGARVVKIMEKPSAKVAAGKPINAGIYVFSQEIFEAIKQTKDSSRGEQEITDSIQMLIKSGKKVVAAEISSGDWRDVGRPWDLLEANARMLMKTKPETLGEVEENAHLEGSVFVAEHARIRSGAYIEGPAYVGEGSDIGPNCYIKPYTSIGRNVRVGNACEIKNCIIMDRSHIAHLSYVGDSIIGEDCNLGAGTITANLRLDYKPVKMIVRDTVIDTGKEKLGVIMGDNVKTGVGTLLMPGVKVGCNSWIGPNVNVSRDVPSDTILLVEQSLSQRSR